MSSDSKEQWIKLESINSDSFDGPLKISDNELVIITDDNEWMRYDSRIKQWEKMFHRNNINQFGTIDTISYDRESNKYYIFDRDDVIIIDGDHPDSLNKCTYNDKDVGLAPVSVFINGKYHIIGGFYNNTHIVFDTETQTFETVHVFNEWEKGNSGPGLVYIASRNEMILFGGFDDKQHEDGWLDEMWRYSLNDNLWTKLTVKLPEGICDFPYFLTNNEKYIVLINEEEIFYWKLDTTAFKQSVLKLPEEYYCKSATMTGNAYHDMILVNGFIRSTCKMENMFLPNDIIQIIMNWYICEYIHVFDPYTVNDEIVHLEINISDIIPDYKTC